MARSHWHARHAAVLNADLPVLREACRRWLAASRSDRGYDRFLRWLCGTGHECERQERDYPLTFQAWEFGNAVNPYEPWEPDAEPGQKTAGHDGLSVLKTAELGLRLGEAAMAARGVHFALTAEEETRLVDEPDADEGHLIDVLSEIEERWDRDWLVETDKAWDAIHRCLTDGTLNYGHEPLEKCVLGTGYIYEGDNYIINFLEADEVKEVAEAIKDIDRGWMRKKYDAIDPADYGQPLSDDDFEYTWTYFVDLRAFFQKAAKHNRAVVFSADQ